MKLRLIVVLCILFGTTTGLFADNSTSQSQGQNQTSQESSSQSQKGFGLQSAIFSEVRSAGTNLSNNLSNISEYSPTPGDVYTLTIVESTSATGTGERSSSFPVQLNEDMTLDVPFIGTISARGKTIPELRKQIVQSVLKTVPVQYANFILTTPAQFNVFVYGGVNSPGYVVANPLVTVIDAIALAKGFKAGASYRRIELFHDGKKETLDIAKYYADADMKANPRLQPGDKIFVPQAQIVTDISGKVKYPGSYELLPSENLQTLINLAGGTTPGALDSRIEISRINTDGSHEMLNVSLDHAKSFKISMGDQVKILSTSQNSEVVTVEGAVYGSSHSGETPVSVPRKSVRIDFPYFPGISLLAVLDAVGGPTPYAKAGQSYILEHSTGKKIPLRLAELWKTRNQALNRELHPGDQIVVPMETLQVFVTGQVTNPGAEPYQPDLTVADYLLYAGGINENTADPNGIFLVDFKGNRTKIAASQTVTPGSVIYVARKPLFQVNQFFQNFFLTTGWVTTLISAASILYNFLVLIHVL